MRPTTIATLRLIALVSQTDPDWERKPKLYQTYKAMREGGQASFCLPTIGEDVGFVPRGQTMKLSAHPTGLLSKCFADGSEQPLPTSSPRLMTAAEIDVAAKADPDARPMTAKNRGRPPAFPASRRCAEPWAYPGRVCHAVSCAAWHIRDWEQGRTEPDQPTRAYLAVIAHDPEGVRRALQQSQPT